MSEQNILFFCRTMGQGGTEKVVIQLCEILISQVNSITVCSTGGVNVDVLKRLGVKHYVIPDVERKDPITIFKIVNKVKRIIKNENITIIHSHHRMAVLYASICSAGLPIPLVATAHNIFYDKKTLTKWIYSKTEIIACGKQVENNLVDYYGIDPASVQTISNAIHSEDHDVIPDEKITYLRRNKYLVVGNAGRLTEQKGLDTFIKAAVELKKNIRKFVLVVIGDGEQRQGLEHLADRLGVKENILFMGYQSDVQNIMKQLDFIVLSSRWEGFPLTPIEAFSCGKTVIATDIPGTNDIVRDGVNGLLVPVDSPRKLASAIESLANNRKQLEHLEEGARASYKSEFSFQKFSDKISQFYYEMGQKNK